MRIVAIEHYRCSELEHTTRWVIPEGMDTFDVEAAISMAKQAYLDAVELEAKSASDELGPEPSYDISDPRNKNITVGEYLERQTKYQKARNIQQSQELKTANSFHHYMRNAGFVELFKYKGLDLIEETVDWGHRHGTKLNY